MITGSKLLSSSRYHSSNMGICTSIDTSAQDAYVERNFANVRSQLPNKFSDAQVRSELRGEHHGNTGYRGYVDRAAWSNLRGSRK
jgi:hypothetical protein